MFQRPFELAQDNPEFLKTLERQKQIFDFHTAIQLGDKDEIEKHIQKIGDVNEPCQIVGHPPLMIAARNNDFEMMKFLVEKGCNVNSFSFCNFGLYEVGMQLPDTRIFEFLKEQKTLPFEELKSAVLKLCDVSSKGDIVTFDQIIQEKFNNQITPIVACTMADKAVRGNDPKPIELLHQKGVTYHLITYVQKHHTILHFATSFQADKVVDTLLKQGMNPDILNYKKQTPLVLASMCRDATPVMKNLLAFGANLNAKDFLGKTAAHWAVEYNQGENLKFLIDKGIDLSIKNIFGETAFDLAQNKNNFELAHVIETAKAPRLVQKSTPIKNNNHQTHQRGEG